MAQVAAVTSTVAAGDYPFGMPRRTTPFQAIVHLVRQHHAGPGVTVTESKFLDDPVLGQREVDIVVEAEADGERVVISLEVNQRGRPASVEWVEQQIDKHRRLPTNKLVLVSRAGFSRKALTRVGLEQGKVEALQPEIVMIDGEPVVKRLYVESITYDPSRCTVHVRGDQSEIIAVTGQPETDIYDADGVLLGALAYLAREAAHLEGVGKWLGVEAHHHPKRDELKTFEFVLSVGGLGYHLKQNETGTLHLIIGLEIWGHFTFTQDEVALALARLGDRVYGAGEASFTGRPVVWVGTTKPGTAETKLSWRATDANITPSSRPAMPAETPKVWFPRPSIAHLARAPETRHGREPCRCGRRRRTGEHSDRRGQGCVASVASSSCTAFIPEPAVPPLLQRNNRTALDHQRPFPRDRVNDAGRRRDHSPRQSHRGQDLARRSTPGRPRNRRTRSRPG